ncbi:MAG TPA: CUAEP/CCAEP-tail radical SAM protein [Candidatus Krumholzibacteria bacterium]|nr:CUAEP/CCAEP-tail radical SAM protein [Candidatus Krumholzibacteria bacterium]
MTAAPEILLVSCYELGHEPLGLVVPAAVFARAGIRVGLVDLAVEAFDETAFANARLVAISVPMHTALRLGLRVAARVRAITPDAHVCFYGLYAGLNRPHLVPGAADSCFGAEYETALLELGRRILAAQQAPARAVRAPEDADPSARSPVRSIVQRPARDAIAHRAHYAHLADGETRREVGYTQTTRGCKHTCRHCPLPPAYGGTFYALPPGDVLDDIAALVERGASHITFADPDFLNGPGHALRVARAMAARFPGVTFDYTAKIEHLLHHERVVDELHEIGCLFVVSALESLNDTVLARLLKGHTRADALAVARRFRARGLALRPSLVPFTPWENRASLADLMDVVAGEGLVGNIDPVQYSIRLLLPERSLLLADESMAACIEGFDPAMPGYRWRHPDPSMDALQRELARLAEQTSRFRVPVEESFNRIRDLVAPGRDAVVPRAAGPSPRLTEDWFC